VRNGEALLPKFDVRFAGADFFNSIVRLRSVGFWPKIERIGRLVTANLLGYAWFQFLNASNAVLKSSGDPKPVKLSAAAACGTPGGR
jgi:hypothetical protein